VPELMIIVNSALLLSIRGVRFAKQLCLLLGLYTLSYVNVAHFFIIGVITGDPFRRIALNCLTYNCSFLWY